MTNWNRVEDGPPPKGEDYFSFYRSVPVLAVAQGRVWLATLETWTGWEDEFEPRWIMQGQDGWELEGVTHWAPLPDPPEDAS